MAKNTLLLFLFLTIIGKTLHAQVGDCPYPVIFVHGWISDDFYWEGTSKDADFNAIWGNHAGVFNVVVNATDTHDRNFLNTITAMNDNINGPDGTFDNDGINDDVQWIFPNDDNSLNPGCIYSLNFNNLIAGNGDLVIRPTSSSAPCSECSDSNESAVTKQGYALSAAIEAVLAANPGKEKVVLVGHSMGGLCSREYLQRTDAAGNPRWWVDPAAPDGHKVAKLLTAGTPHRGSNTMGNLSLHAPDGGETARAADVLPDLRSEAVRDLRYSYAAATGQDPAGPYLFGGKESDIPDYFPWYWSRDVNCDGDENDDIVGINVAGSPRAWDGTTDNPAMPLPTNVRYTYYVSNVAGSGGDGVVDDERQWLFMGGDGTTAFGYSDGLSIPVPHDGVDYRLADRVDGLFGTTHSDQSSDVPRIMQGLDEGDYPKFAWKINMDNTYAGMAQMAPAFVPADGNRASGEDRDWYMFDLAAAASGITIRLQPNADLAGRLDFYDNPADYELGDASASLSFPAGTTAEQTLRVVGCFAVGRYYVRITHENVGVDDWKNAFTIRAETHTVDLATTVGTYTATHETTDRNGWTHYWKAASANPATPNDVLLLSLQKDGTLQLAPAQVTVGLGGGSIDLSAAAYVPPSAVWFTMSRYWDANPSTQPASVVPVRFYYTQAEFDALQAAVQGAGEDIPTPSDMVAYKFSSGSGVNPNPASGHVGGDTGNFLNLGHSDADCNGFAFAQFSVNGFSGGGLGGSMGVPLPVELVDFYGERQERVIDLYWETASEENADKFIVERSADGNRFEPIGEVAAKNAEAGADYGFSDISPLSGNNYYRLVMRDLDGTVEYSGVLHFDFRQSGTFSVKAYPVPFQDGLNLEMSLPETGEVQVRLFDAAGRMLFSRMETAGSGILRTRLELSHLPKGIYFLKVAQGGYSETLRVVK